MCLGQYLAVGTNCSWNKNEKGTQHICVMLTGSFAKGEKGQNLGPPLMFWLACTTSIPNLSKRKVNRDKLSSEFWIFLLRCGSRKMQCAIGIFMQPHVTMLVDVQPTRLLQLVPLHCCLASRCRSGCE